MEPEGRINRQMEQEGGMNFTVGQEVWSTLFGKGVVISIDEYPEYPVKVKFEEDYFTFTTEGAWCGSENPSLFPYPVKVVPEDIPDYPFILDGKPFMIGTFLAYEVDNQLKRGKVDTIYINKSGIRILFNNEGLLINLEKCSWPSPNIKKIWAYLIAGMPGPMSIGFTEPMPESEAREKYGQVWEVPDFTPPPRCSS